ncbi:MAG TPA: hypothetical protein VFL14_03325 [Xanthomonadales bacterium]|nr:hypothetical protein [Xanthomonadales bacterium]
MKAIRILAGILLAVLVAAPVAAKEYLVDPEPIPVPQNLDDAKIEQAVKASLVARTWTVDAVKPGHIDASLHLRKHVANIAIDWAGGRAVTIKYVSSENLDFKEKRGKRYIHGNYLGWIEYLKQDIQRNLQNAAVL